MYNWPKRPPVYINIDDDSAEPVQKRRNIMNRTGEQQGNKMQSGKGDSGQECGMGKLESEPWHKTNG